MHFANEYDRRAKYYQMMVVPPIDEDDIGTEDDRIAQRIAAEYRLIASELRNGKFAVAY